MKHIFATLFICLAIVILPVGISLSYAGGLSVSGAKASGLIGEQDDGLLGTVQPSPDASSLVRATNAARLQKYKSVAASNGLSLSQVQKLAGEKLIRETPSGQYVRSGGRWSKK